MSHHAHPEWVSSVRGSVASGGSRALTRLQIVCDAVAVMASMGAAAVVQRVLADRWAVFKQPVAFHEYALVAYLALPLFLFLVGVFGLGSSVAERWTKAETVGRLLMLHAVAFLGVSALQFVTQSVVNRTLVGLFFFCVFVLTTTQRLALTAWVDVQYRRSHGPPILVLMGEQSPRMADFVRDALRARHPPTILGRLSDVPMQSNDAAVAEASVALLGPLASLSDVLHENAVREVVFFAPYHHPEVMQAELMVCEQLGVPAHFVVDLAQVARARPRIADLYAHPTVSFDVAPKAAASLAMKHAVDPILAAFALVAALPVLTVAVVGILVSMGRPVFFVQTRAGLRGRPFRMFKLRTMCAGAEAQRDALAAYNEMGGPAFKMTDDPRVTAWGAFLRRTSIDELPQLLNVVNGTMSLVGPRPLPVAEQAQIRGVERRRLSMKPGITCLWQISGRSDLDFDDWMLLDLRYVDEWSLWLDLTVLLRTIPVVLFRRGAR